MITPFSGLHKLSVKILNRPIRGSPFSVHVKPTQKRIWSLKEGNFSRIIIVYVYANTFLVSYYLEYTESLFGLIN